VTTANKRVLVLDADGQAGLSIVRSLGGRGIPVTAGSSRRFSLGGVSKHSSHSIQYPEPSESAPRFVSHLVEYLSQAEHAIVLPVRDSTSTICARHKPAIEGTGATVAIEGWEQFERAYDKGRLFTLAESLRVPTPRTYDPGSLAAVEEIAPDVPYPALVKPRSKTVWDRSGECHYTRVADTHYVETPGNLVETYRETLNEHPVLEDQNHFPLVQEYIEGTTTTTVVVASQGDIFAYFQEERIRTYPSSGGNSTLLRETSCPRMLESASRLIDALNWTGPAMVEFMRTPEGVPYLIEVNGRYWGSVPFAIESGLDVPWLHYRLLQGLDVEPPESIQANSLHHRLLYLDLKWLYEQLRLGNAGAVPQFLWACLVARQTFVSTEDPRPTVWALCESVDLLARAALRRLSN
jgi:predicted ATP-grasp superfamily ATP-dependent carboligase